MLMLTSTDPRKIYKITMKLKNSNASGYDGISHELIRQCANALCILPLEYYQLFGYGRFISAGNETSYCTTRL